MNTKLDGIKESTILRINALSLELKAQGIQIYNLGIGEMKINTPSYIQDYVRNRLDQNRYTDVYGLKELRELIANNANAFYSITTIKPDNVIVCAGVRVALYMCFFALLDQGDELIVINPYWKSYQYINHIVGGRTIEVNSNDDFSLNIDNIRSAITNRTKVIVINYPNNPTGIVYSKQSLLDLAHLANEHNLTVICDDIYNKITYTPEYTPITQVGVNNLVIVSGFSKSQALTGWRVGYVIGDKDFINKIGKFQSQTYGNTPVICQLGAIGALKAVDDIPPFLDILTTNRQIAIDMLSTVDNISFFKPQGGFYIVVNISKITNNTDKFCNRCLNECGVVVIPGSEFNIPDYIRISFAMESEEFKQGLEKFIDYLKSYKD